MRHVLRILTAERVNFAAHLVVSGFAWRLLDPSMMLSINVSFDLQFQFPRISDTDRFTVCSSMWTSAKPDYYEKTITIALELIHYSENVNLNDGDFLCDWQIGRPFKLLLCHFYLLGEERDFKNLTSKKRGKFIKILHLRKVAPKSKSFCSRPCEMAHKMSHAFTIDCFPRRSLLSSRLASLGDVLKPAATAQCRARVKKSPRKNQLSNILHVTYCYVFSAFRLTTTLPDDWTVAGNLTSPELHQGHRVWTADMLSRWKCQLLSHGRSSPTAPHIPSSSRWKCAWKKLTTLNFLNSSDQKLGSVFAVLAASSTVPGFISENL